MPCPLCDLAGARSFTEANGRRYLRCGRCLLTFVDPRDRISTGDERARYETHDNNPADPRYRAFLDRVAIPLAERLEPAMEGLDYGSGPGPTLSTMMTERGFPTAVYDPFFAHDRAALARTYDFITCTETVEHFFHPGDEFRRLEQLLRRPGWLAVMTQMLEHDDGFETWWYARDPTHVCFYRAETLEWIAQAHGWSLERVAPTVAIFEKARRDSNPI
jgi:hypothetical protein